MSTTMVGDETELKSVPIETDGSQKEIKKVGLINSFFKPVAKSKEDAKSKLGAKKTVNCNQDSDDGISNRINTEIFQKSNQSGLFDQKDKCFKKKTCDDNKQSSEEEFLKTKQTKPKWSVTGAVRNYSKCLSSSGSEFEDDGKILFTTKTKEAQKSKKNKGRTQRGSEISAQKSEGISSMESVGDEDKESKSIKKSRKLVENVKTRTGSKCNSGTQESNENSTECMDVEEKERRSVRENQTMASNKAFIKPGFDEEIELITDKLKPDNISKASSSSEENKEARISAFDVLMKSQRVQKTEDHSAESSVIEASQTAVIPCDIVVDNLRSCEITDVKEKLQSEATVTCQSKSPSSRGESSSDKIGNISSFGTNAFDFLMKKGRLSKSPCGVDSQVESELESEALETVEGPLKKKSKKKSFEFQLSIRASKKKDIEFSIESESVSSGGDNCQNEEKAEWKSKKKTRKHKKNSRSDSAEGNSDPSFVGEKCEEEGREVSRSKRGKKMSTVKSKVNNEKDSADVSLLEVNSEKEKKKSDKKRRKSGRKSVSNAEIVVMDVDPNKANHEKNFEPPTQNVRKKAKPQRTEKKNRVDIQEKDIKKKRKSKKSDRDSLAEQLPSIEGKQNEASNFKDTDEVVQTKMGKDQSEAGSSHDTKIKAANRYEKAVNKREMETESEHSKKNSVSSEPKTIAAIFLKRKPVPSKPDTEEDNQITTISLVSSTSVTCPVNVSASMTNEQSTIDKEPPQPMEKSAVEKEAANQAFKALFTGASSQKTASSASVADALPAPWPSVSHVFQKDGNASLDGSFWHLPWPIVKDHKFDVSLHGYLFLDGPLANMCRDTSALSTQDHIMFCGRRNLGQSLDNKYKLERKTAHPNFPEAVTKKLLSELALFYPGVPLRKLYKRYATKLQKYKASSVAVESKQVVPVKKMPVDDATSNLKLLESKKGEQEVETKSLPGRRGRGKRRMSSDGGVRQEQKIARKRGDFFTTVPSEDQGLSTDLSGNKSCKKRQREKDSDQPPEEACKSRRLSTRLQKKKTAVETETVDDNLLQPETSSNRKKRKITTDSKPDVTEMPDLCKEEEKFPDTPVIANNEKTLSFVSDTIWTDLYRPVHSTEVMANASAVSKLRSWLEEWKIKREKTLRKELQQQRRLLAKQKGESPSSQSSSHTLEWWDADSDSDFQMSDDDSDDSDTEGVGLSTAMFISGPTGVGKTAMVYACAEELGYKVFEVNSSSKRSGKHILSQLEEATQSHLVINNKTTTTSKGPVPESSFAGLFSKPVKNSLSASGPLGAFLQPTGRASQSKDKKGEKGSKGKKGKEKKEKTKVKGKSILKQPLQAASNDGTESNLSSKAASLILFEEVDVIFEEDKSFWMAVNSFMQNAKCPIVLISTESQVSCEGRYDQITLKHPSVNLLAAHLQLLGLMNNMFINPDDLKSFVAHNNCDIRKSLLNLQFWSASGGGVKIPYKRPASLKDKDTLSDKSQTPQPMSISHATNTTCVTTDVVPSHEVPHLETIITSGVLNDDGEESLFLSLSDWQVIKSGGLRRSSHSSCSGSLKPTEGDNSDSDFCEPKRKTLVCADGSTDSIFEITDTNDSQPVSSSDKRPDDSLQLPHMESMLFESVHGLLNCVPEPNKGSLSVLRKEEKPGVTQQDNNSSEKLHLAHFSQVLGVSVTHTNLCNLMPLFADSSASQQKEKSELQAQESKSAPLVPLVSTEDGKTKSESIFSDTSLFDDGTEPCDNKMADERGVETGACPEKKLEECNTKNASSSQASTDTGFSESQIKEETGEGGQDQGHEIDTEAVVQKGSELVHRKSSDEEKCTSKALEIFAQFAENMSFADAYCPNLSSTQSNSAQYGWWGAPLKPGLTDEHVTVQESRNWLACDTRASISGALEVANLESCFVKVKLLTEDLKDIGNSLLDENTEDQTSIELCNFNTLSEDLPPHDSNAVLRLDAVTQTQKSSVTSRRKLYNSLGSCIPVLNHCNHRSVVCDYIPTFRLLCHSERLREAAHIKRRFLHYLDSNSFPMSRPTMDALADSYLAL